MRSNIDGFIGTLDGDQAAPARARQIRELQPFPLRSKVLPQWCFIYCAARREAEGREAAWRELRGEERAVRRGARGGLGAVGTSAVLFMRCSSARDAESRMQCFSWICGQDVPHSDMSGCYAI